MNTTKNSFASANDLTIGAKYNVNIKGFPLPVPARILGTKGRWVKVTLLDSGQEFNVGFSDIVSIFNAPKTGNLIPKTYADTYTRTKLEDGSVSVDNNDDVAQMLRGESLSACYSAAAKKLGVSPAHLREKYEHLNNGMQRMCVGNILRKALRDADKDEE